MTWLSAVVLLMSIFYVEIRCQTDKTAKYEKNKLRFKLLLSPRKSSINRREVDEAAGKETVQSHGWSSLLRNITEETMSIEGNSSMVLGRRNDNGVNKHSDRIVRMHHPSKDFLWEYQNSNAEENNRETREAVKRKMKRNLCINESRDQCSVEKSCRERCGNSRKALNRQSYSCYCDLECYFVYQDCCADYEEYCGEQQQKRTTNTKTLERSMVSCVPGYEKTGKNIWMVTKCNQKWPTDKTMAECQNTSTDATIFEAKTIHNYLPVLSENNVVYRNAFCAQCNNVKNFEYFLLNITCPILPPFSFSSLEKVVEFVQKYCGPRHIFVTLKPNQIRRYCSNYIVDVCTVPANNSRNCSKGPVAVVTANGRNYRNIWCAKCHKISNKLLNCGLAISVGASGFGFHVRTIMPSFSIAMDYSNEWKISLVSHVCPTSEGMVYDAYLQTCRRGLAIPPVKDLVDKYQIAMWLTNEVRTVQISIDKAHFVSAVTQHFPLNISQISRLSINVLSSYWIADFEVVLTNIQSLSIKTGAGKSKRMSNKLVNLLHFKHEFQIKIDGVMLKVFKITSRQLACITKQVFSAKEYILLHNGKYYINATKKIYSANDIFLNGQDVTVCGDLVSSKCEGFQIYLKSEEYTEFSNLSIFYKRTEKLYNFGEYDIKNNYLMLCVNISTSSEQAIKTNAVQSALGVLTIITFTVSLFCLVALIITYSIFSELRKLPGKNVLNLVISLFLAQLLWLVGMPRTEWPVVCQIIAILEHYLFLVTFAAMAIIAYHTRITLASKKLRQRATPGEDKKRFIIYCLLVWGIPGLLVSISTFLEEQNIYNIGYSSKYQKIACWMSNREAQLVFFVSPIGLILLFNIITLTYTIIIIHQKKSCSQGLYASSSNRQEQSTIWMYLKLSSLTGFTWLFGFCDIFVHSTPLFSFLFVLFASLQGLYIAISFIVKKRIMKLYRDLLRGRQQSSSGRRGKAHGSNATNITETGM